MATDATRHSDPLSTLMIPWSLRIDFNLCSQMPKCVPDISLEGFTATTNLTSLNNNKKMATNSLLCLPHGFLSPRHPDIILSTVIDGLHLSCSCPQPVSCLALLSSLKWSPYWAQWLSDFPTFSAAFSSATALFWATVPYTVSHHGDLTYLSPSSSSPASLFSPSDLSTVTLLNADKPDHIFSPPL